MGNIVFKPWVGSNYTTNKFGARILVLGESHYGSPEDEYEDYTIDVVKMWGQENRLAFFTKIAKTLLNYDSSDYLNEHERYALWENVSFYNYVQAIVGEGARIRPTGEMWQKSEVAFKEVIERLDPQIIIVFGKELADSNIAVNCVTPAAARTAIFDQMSQEHIDYMLSKIPRGRFVEVKEISSMIAWMVSAENSFTTGAVFDLSGGRSTY